MHSAAGAGAFRFDINALRALSVVAVVGFHYQMQGFSGGFSGVDVFLVITGYLMTGKVLKELERGNFSLFTFGMMRVRRIYPALAMVAIASVTVGWFVTLPDQYLKHLLQALSALAFVSNFAFSSDNGYFAMAAQSKPLLHTWSLSVEWQFYIWMPFIVALVWRLRSVITAKFDAVIFVLIAAALASLVWCLWKSQNDATGSAFFSLTARAWEPLTGGLIAAAEIRVADRLRFVRTPLTAIAGWLLVVACIIYPLPEQRWPNSATILPVLGAGMVVASRQWAGASDGLALRPIQRLGDWSYSIYLWHWPIWVFALGWLSVRGYDVEPAYKAMMVAASICMGWASYRLVEQPVRLHRDFWTQRKLIICPGAIFAGGACFVALAFLGQGFPSRLPEYLLPAEMARRTGTPRDECFRDSNSIKRASERYCSFGSIEGEPSALLWGDSFANQYLGPLSSAAVEHKLHGLIATQSGCRPFLADTAAMSGEPTACREFNRSTLEFALGHPELRIVVLGGNWMAAAEVGGVIDRLLAAGKTVVLIMPLLDIGFDLPERWIENQLRAGHAIEEWKVKAEPSLILAKLRASVVETMSNYEDSGRLIAVDPQSVVCDAEYCYLVRGGQANFRDRAHISNINADQYRPLFTAALREARSGVTLKSQPCILSAPIEMQSLPLRCAGVP